MEYFEALKLIRSKLNNESCSSIIGREVIIEKVMNDGSCNYKYLQFEVVPYYLAKILSDKWFTNKLKLIIVRYNNLELMKLNLT